ncbi:MAG TPA: hypothetical protein VF571_05015 [Pyrinomonadaceae bacterium]|jgi:hypothetical protein
MNHLAIKRKHVLGDLYNSCEVSESIPVFIEDQMDEPVGYADSSLGVYVDAFLFHLPEDVCKKLSTGHYKFGLDYDLSGNKNKVKLNHILLVSNKPAAVSRRIIESSTPKE